jgi:galactokinase
MTFAGLEGGGGVGTFSGSEDHTAMICAKAGLMSAYRFVPVRHIEDVALPGDWSFVVASSGVPAEKAGAAQALYNRASLSARGLLEIWNETHEGQPALADALRSAPGAVDELRAVLEQAGAVPGRFPWTAADLDRRLAHFVAEDGRIPQAVDAFRAADAARLGAIALASQRDAATLLDNQIPETMALAELARTSGAFASCAFGAGFGGSVWALTSRAEAHVFGDRWMHAYRRRYPGRTSATWFVSRPGPGMLEVF